MTSNQTQLKPVRYDGTKHCPNPIAHCEHAFKLSKPTTTPASVFQDNIPDVAMGDIMEGDHEISGVLHLREC